MLGKGRVWYPQRLLAMLQALVSADQFWQPVLRHMVEGDVCDDVMKQLFFCVQVQINLPLVCCMLLVKDRHLVRIDNTVWKTLSKSDINDRSFIIFCIVPWKCGNSTTTANSVARLEIPWPAECALELSITLWAIGLGKTLVAAKLCAWFI